MRSIFSGVVQLQVIWKKSFISSTSGFFLNKKWDAWHQPKCFLSYFLWIFSQNVRKVLPRDCIAEKDPTEVVCSLYIGGIHFWMYMLPSSLHLLTHVLCSSVSFLLSLLRVSALPHLLGTPVTIHIWWLQSLFFYTCNMAKILIALDVYIYAASF